MENIDLNNFMDIFKNRDGILNEENKQKYAQYYTPVNIAHYMAGMFKEPNKKKVTVLDPGCGIGILTGAFLYRLLTLENSKIKKVFISMYEIDSNANEILKENMSIISNICKENGIIIEYEILNKSFILSTSEIEISKKYDYVIMNPPYMKLSTDSIDDVKLKQLEINVPNYYAAFISISQKLMSTRGELVAITPRSFCNGAYFLSFREMFLRNMSIDKIHLFESRRDVFREDEVLQENIIFHCVKKESKSNDKIKILHSYGDSFEDIRQNIRRLEDVIFPNDSNLTIRILKNEEEKEISKKINSLKCKLSDLDIEISTGPVVDFREREAIQSREPLQNSIPYFFSEHLTVGGIKWPKDSGKKYNYITINENNIKKMRENGNYVLVKRMTSKEEMKRIVSVICVGNEYDYKYLAFDNKINYFHKNKKGISLDIARGLTLFLNSTVIDTYFRTFSGNTQVNATDLKSLHYPTELQLKELGSKYDNIYLHQELIDDEIERVLFS